MRVFSGRKTPWFNHSTPSRILGSVSQQAHGTTGLSSFVQSGIWTGSRKPSATRPAPKTTGPCYWRRRCVYLQNREEWRDHVSGLKPLVADQPNLLAAIDERLKPSKHDKELERLEKKEAEQKKQEERRDAKNRDSWIQFWRDVAEHPESAFSSERSWDTAWNLWQAMSHDGKDSRASGWNRRFIEEQFGRETAGPAAVHSDEYLARRPSHPSK